MFSLGNSILLLRGCDKSSTLREKDIATGEEVCVQREHGNPMGYGNAVVVKNKASVLVGRVAREETVGCAQMLDGLGSLGIQFRATFVSFGTEENRYWTDTTASINLGYFYVGDAACYNEKVRELGDFLQGKMGFASLKASLQPHQRAVANVSPAPSPAFGPRSSVPDSVDVAKSAVSVVTQLAESVGALESDKKRLAGERGDLEREVKRLKGEATRFANAETERQKLQGQLAEKEQSLALLQSEKGQMSAQLQEKQSLLQRAAICQRGLEAKIGTVVRVGPGREQQLMEGVEWRLVGAKIAVDDGGAFKQADGGEFIVERTYQQIGTCRIFACWTRFETRAGSEIIDRYWISGDHTVIKTFKRLRVWIESNTSH